MLRKNGLFRKSVSEEAGRLHVIDDDVLGSLEYSVSVLNVPLTGTRTPLPRDTPPPDRIVALDA
jgi:hypothetical protein